MGERKTTRKRKPPRVPKPTATPGPASDPFGFWKTKAVEQGAKPVAKVEDLTAPPGSLWRDDREFDEFLAWLRANRQERG
jgi:hypothetical protein